MMRVLWITNIIFPNLAQKMGKDKTVIGGWTYSAAAELKTREEVELAVASPYSGDHIGEYDIDDIKYFTLPYGNSVMKYSKRMEESCREVNERFHPDVVHIYGTEYPITLAFLNACGNNNVVVSLQGIPCIYTRYIFLGISVKDLLRYPILFLLKKRFDANNENERKALSKCKFFEGRSDWDHAISWSFSPDSKYFHCNRTLRPVFYQKQWDINKIERHSIFLSQAQYPIKGLHQVIKSLPFIVRQYPDVKIYVAGDSPFKKSSAKNFIKAMGYGSYLRRLVSKHNVEKYFVFIGLLNEEAISEQYLKANVFICPSTIENVPNSVAEAQILGVPCIASYVGGDSSLIDEGVNGILYRFEEYEMLAKYVCDIFGNDNFALKLSVNGRSTALGRHDKNKNMNDLINMYHSIMDNK